MPVDTRSRLSADLFQPTGEGEWTTPWQETRIPFDEFIYAWSVQLPEEEGFRLFLSARFVDGGESPWLYAGFWGDVDLVESRSRPTFEHGRLLLDHLFLDKKADAYRFRVVDEGRRPLTTLPALSVVATDNSPTGPAVAVHSVHGQEYALHDLVLDLPLRRQESSDGERMPDRCQSAALATALQYFGDERPLEEIERLIYDPEYRHPGIWPRIIATATQLGHRAYIDRFRDWNDVRQALLRNKVILASITMPADLDYIAPPYSSMGGHIVAINGVTADGRVVVTDSALGVSGEGYLCQWLMEDFEKVWFGQKGGVAMVIEPPSDAEIQRVEELPPFPGDRRRRTEAE